MQTYTTTIEAECQAKGINLDTAYVVKCHGHWVNNRSHNLTDIIEWQTHLQKTIQPYTVSLSRSLDNMVETIFICDDSMMTYLTLMYNDYIYSKTEYRVWCGSFEQYIKYLTVFGADFSVQAIAQQVSLMVNQLENE